MGKRTSQLNEITTIDNNDILYGVDVDDLTHSPDGTSVKFKKSNLLKEVVQGISDNAGDISDIQTDIGEINDQITDIYSAIAQGYTGWNPVTAGCTYQGADAPSYSMYIEGNANQFLTLGMRILLTNGGSPKMFILTLIGSYDAGNDRTLLTMYGGTDYTLANSAITDVYFSPHKAPYGFPVNPAKWSVTFNATTQVVQASPSANTVYNTGNSIIIPIGVWDITFHGLVGGNFNGQNCRLGCALSRATNSVTDQIFRYFYGSGDTTATFPSFVRRGTVIHTSKTTYYVVMWTTRNGYTNIFANSGDSYTSIVVTSAYL